jgi:hypothetical protein
MSQSKLDFYFIEIGTCHRRTRREEKQAGNCRLFFTTSQNTLRRERASFFVEAQFAGPRTNSRLTEQFLAIPEFLSP